MLERIDTLESENKLLKTEYESLQKSYEASKTNIELNVIQICSLLPHLESKLDEKDRSRLDPIWTFLQKIQSSFTDKIEPALPELTQRERVICSLIREKKSSQQIADSLGISKATVDKHRQSIRRKFEITKIRQEKKSKHITIEEYIEKILRNR